MLFSTVRQVLQSSLLLVCLLECSGQMRVSVPGLGEVEGSTETTYFTNRTFHKFRGIPYAEPPVGENRFMRPIKKKPWEGVLNATEFGDMCLQLTDGHSNGSEDCLFLDVYSPQVSNSSKLPVLFYIHGGSYIEGTSRNVKPIFILEHDLVLVAAQYRLGPLGFLTLNSTNRTGNAGLYDVWLALQWVHDNIQSFGGDPDRITVSGNSAGAGITALLYVSPLTQNVIKQVMLFSGSALAQWAIDTNPITSSRLIANDVGCNSTRDDDVLTCLQNLDSPIELTAAYNKLSAQATAEGTSSSMGGTTPIVDNEILVELPELTLNNNTFQGRPMFMSVTKNEGIFLASVLPENRRLSVGASDIQHNTVEFLMKITGIQDPTYTVAAAIVDNYFLPGDLSYLHYGIIDFLGAAYFKGPALKMTQLNTQRNGTTYLVTFNYDPRGEGVDHMVEQHYLFARNVTGFTEADYSMAEKFTKLCANFVMKGSPAEDSTVTSEVPWSPYSPLKQTYLVFDEDVELREGFEQEFTISKEKRKIKEENAAGINCVLSVLFILPIFLSIKFS